MRKIFWILVPLVLLGAYLAWSQPQVEPLPVQDEVVLVPEVENVEEDEDVAKEASVSFAPASVIQGEPLLVTVEDAEVRSISFNGTKLGVFENSALLGLDLRMTPGTYPVVATLSDGTTVKKSLVVGKRAVVEAPLGIPEELGGDTPAAEQQLLTTLAQEGLIINAIPTSPTKLWNGEFRMPLDPPITITDTYGYSRLTGASSIAHKGTDFRAAVGTPVYAMNSGKVAYVGFLRNYGHVVAVDHGLGLLTIYMHLSKVQATRSNLVEKGELIAYSGDTGYVLGPHLHLTVRINNISVDPMKFAELMGE